MEQSVDAFLSMVKAGEDWEKVLFESACAGAREIAKRLLGAVDDALAASREPGLIIEGYRARTVLTRFGPVRVNRRLYAQGRRRRFLLDEALGWTRRRAISPALALTAAQLASHLPFRRAAELLGMSVSQCIGATTLHRLIQNIGATTTQEETAARSAVFEQGQDPPTGSEVADQLFVEADGLTISLQREAEGKAELKAAIAYTDSQLTGVDQKGRKRKQLLGKVTYAGMEPSGPFWEGAWLTIHARFDLRRLQRLVLGGDGAEWIRRGLQGMRGGIFQLDRFHLIRVFRQVLGGAGIAAFRATRVGNDDQMRIILARAWESAGADPGRQHDLEGLEHYLSSNHDGLIDWQLRVGAESSVCLGAMEANIDKPFAQRFKKRGMSWTKRGAHHMAKVLQLRENQQLPHACQARPLPILAPPRRRASAASTAPPRPRGADPPFQATFVPRFGPHAARPWVQALRRLIDDPTIR